jgi:hypothetical protein
MAHPFSGVLNRKIWQGLKGAAHRHLGPPPIWRRRQLSHFHGSPHPDTACRGCDHEGARWPDDRVLQADVRGHNLRVIAAFGLERDRLVQHGRQPPEIGSGANDDLVGGKAVAVLQHHFADGIRPSKSHHLTLFHPTTRCGEAVRQRQNQPVGVFHRTVLRKQHRHADLVRQCRLQGLDRLSSDHLVREAKAFQHLDMIAVSPEFRLVGVKGETALLADLVLEACRAQQGHRIVQRPGTEGGPLRLQFL